MFPHCARMFIHMGLDSKISFQGVGNLKEEILLYITAAKICNEVTCIHQVTEFTFVTNCKSSVCVCVCVYMIKVYNRTDHILLDRTHCLNVCYVRSMRGAEIESNHFLIRAKIRLKIKKC